jgi:hypothetical protein
MDNIDITSSEFSLGNLSNYNSNILEEKSLDFNINDYLIYIYIVIGLIILSIISFIMYKFSMNKSKRVSFQEKNEEYFIEKDKNN